VITLDHHAAIVRKSSKDCHRRFRIKDIAAVEVGRMAGSLREGRNLHVGVDAKGFGGLQKV